MRRHVSLGVAIVGALLLAGCGSSHTTVLGDSGSFSIRDGRVVLRSERGQQAEIDADGTFSVGGKAVAVTEAQRATLRRYHAAAVNVVEHAAATGKAGVEVGAAAVAEVAKGLASGDTSQIGAKVEAKADGVRSAAARICDDLVEVSGLQATLATEMDAFRPFAVVKPRQIADCRKGVG